MIKILIACTLLLASAGYGEKYVQKNDGLIPGLYQIKTGQKIKGFTIALLEVGTLGGGLYYYLGDIEDKETAWQAYQDLPGGLSVKTYDRYYKEFQDAPTREDINRRRKVFFLSAGAIYLINLLDVALYNPEKVTVSIVPSDQASIALISYRF